MISEAGTHQLQLMKQKIPYMQDKIKEAFPLCHQLTPINLEEYSIRKNQLKNLFNQFFNKNSMNNQEKILDEEKNKPGQNQNTQRINNNKQKQAESLTNNINNSIINKQILEKYNDILLGSIQGLSGQITCRNHLKKIFDIQNQANHNKINQTLDQYLKDKVQTKYYGPLMKKQMNRCLHQIKNLQLISNSFDIKNIKNHRKYRNIYKNSLKSAFKFIQTYMKLEKQQKINKSQQISKLYDQFYRKAYDDQKKYFQMKKKIDETKTVIQKQAPQEIQNIHNPEENKQNYENHLQIQENGVLLQNGKKQSNDDKTDVKSQQDTTAKKTKKNVKNQKKIEKQLEKQKSKESQKQKQKQKSDMQSEISAPIQTPIIKKDKTQGTLECFFKTQIVQKSPQKAIVSNVVTDSVINQEPGCQNSMSMPMTMNRNMQNQREKDQQQLISLLLSFGKSQTQQSTLPSLQDLRKQFISDLKNSNQKMIDQKNIHQHFVNLVLWDSRLQFENHPLTTTSYIKFIQPLDIQDQIRYMDDSYQVYQDLAAENIEQKQQMDNQDQSQFASSANNTIVPDGYLSDAQLSSNQDAKQRKVMKDMRLIKILDGRQEVWQFTYKKLSNNQDMITMIQSLTMFPVLQNDQEDNQIQMMTEDRQKPKPSVFSNNFTQFDVYEEQAEPGSGLTFSLKCDLLKQIHGYYNSKQSLVKKLSLITDKVSQNFLNTWIKQISYKNGIQRLIKQQIIDQIKQSKEDFQTQLQASKQSKDLQIKASQQNKIDQRQQKIQNIILEYVQNDGSKHIFDLLKYLYKKSYRFTKREFQLFLSARVGQKWDSIKNQFTFNKPSVKQKKEKTKQEIKINTKENGDIEKSDKMIDQNQQNQESKKQSKEQSHIHSHSSVQKNKIIEEGYHTPNQPIKPITFMPTLDTLFKKVQQKNQQIMQNNNGVVPKRQRLIDIKRRQQQQRRIKEEQQAALLATEKQKQKERKMKQKKQRDQKKQLKELKELKQETSKQKQKSKKNKDKSTTNVNYAQKMILQIHQNQQERKDKRQRRAPRKDYGTYN